MRPHWVRLRRVAGWLALACLTGWLPLAFASTFAPGLEGAAAAMPWLLLVFTGCWLAAAAGAWWLTGDLRWGIFTPERRRAHLLQLFDEAQRASLERGIWLVKVRSRYQYARQGTKAVVEHVDGRRQDAWFWHIRPRARGVYVVRGSGGYGPHSHSLHVFYVGSRTTGHGIVWELPRAAWRAARRRARASR